MKRKVMKMNDIDTNEVIELDYHKVSTKANFASNLFDGFATLILSFLLLLLNNFIFSKTPLGIQTKNERDDIILSSYLYKKDDKNNIKDVYSLVNDNEELTTDEKSKEYDKTLTYFFTEFVKNENIYKNYKKEAKVDNEIRLFDDDGNRLLTNTDDDNKYFEFYKNVIRNIAPGYLTSSKIYRDNLKKSIIQNILLFYLSLFISNTIFFYIFPLIFYRGRKTLGMKMVNIALVDVNAMSVSFKRFTLRYLFYFFIIITLSLVSFFIPLIVSITMMFANKTGQGLTDYVFNTYKVDSSSSSIYLNKEEYLEVNFKNEDVDIEHINISL